MIQILLAAAAVMAPAVAGTDTASRAAIEAYIKDCEAIWAQAGTTDQSKKIATFIADDYHGVSSGGKVHGKAALLEFGAPSDKEAALYYVKVHFITPSLVIAQGEEWTTPANGGAKNHLIWTDTWLFRAGRWQIVASQDSVRPPETPVQN